MRRALRMMVMALFALVAMFANDERAVAGAGSFACTCQSYGIECGGGADCDVIDDDFCEIACQGYSGVCGEPWCEGTPDWCEQNLGFACNCRTCG